MINAIKEKLGEVIENTLNRNWVINPEKFNDPVAKEISWSPCKRGGSNFKTSSLKQVSRSRIEFRVSAMATIFLAIFVIAIVGAALALFTSDIYSRIDNDIVKIVIPFAFVIPIVMTFVIFNAFTKPVVFDKRIGFFYKGRKPSGRELREQNHSLVRLSEIYAIQLIAETVVSNSTEDGRSSYRSYEINLVLKNRERINAVDHGGLKSIVADAETLSKFLNVPLWNGIT